MRLTLPTLLLLAALTACGDAGDAKDAEEAGSTGATTVGCNYLMDQLHTVAADLDGDGTAEEVTYSPETGACPASLSTTLDDEQPLVEVRDQLPVAAEDGLRKVTLPGRTGDLVLLTLAHPRGGFQAHLYGYADGELAELTVDGKPVLGFVATDAPSEYLSAACTDGGFTVTEAVAHQPIGIAPAWDVVVTTYTVDGNEVTRGERREVADNVLDDKLGSRYPDLVANRLFAAC